jgi:hypothetical protein
MPDTDDGTAAIVSFGYEAGQLKNFRAPDGFSPGYATPSQSRTTRSGWLSWPTPSPSREALTPNAPRTSRRVSHRSPAAAIRKQEQEATLTSCLEDTRQLYNAALEERDTRPSE